MEKHRNIFLLGATGSIGSQVLEVIENKNFKIITIAVGKNIERAQTIIEKYQPEFVSVKEEKDAILLEKKYPHIKFGFGEKGLIDAATYSNKDGVVINAVVGIAGLVPTIEAIKKNRDVLLANKETLVTGGALIRDLLKKYPVKLIPIDSEHSTIAKCIGTNKTETIKKVIITASGGAFRGKTRAELTNVTIKDALQHPTWNMGAKITVDCATMVNKGLEVIEAHYLFDLPYEKIETILHPDSLVHSLVEYEDNSVICEMSKPNMMVPIQYALYEEHLPNEKFECFDLLQMNNLTFKPMDYARYPMLKLAYEVGNSGGIMPTVYNASNEAAVDLFLNDKIKFLEIENIISDTVANYQNIINPSLEEILETDRAVKERIYKKYE